MANIKLLVQGYARKLKGGYIASPAVVLIRTNGLNILVDSGSSKKRLLDALKREKLRPSDIDLIFLTHFHPDHILNIRLFPEAVILDVDTIYRDDKEVLYKKFIPHTDVQVIPTPGHAHEHGALLVETEEGRVAVAGDVFWWHDYDKQKTDYKSLVYRKDPFVKNWKQLVESRKKLLKMADWIIPGHGKIFKVEK